MRLCSCGMGPITGCRVCDEAPEEVADALVDALERALRLAREARQRVAYRVITGTEPHSEEKP